MRNKRLTLGSLFDGSGGFLIGGVLAGIKPVWKSEIEPFPIVVTNKRFPEVKHYGDISKLSGAEIEPVDIITFGSPCQDMSIAGKRVGLDGSKSNLFFEAIRIIKEMRCATNGKYPRYIVWENVLGAFSSNGGEDFGAVLESICSIKESNANVPRLAKWSSAGEIVADNYSVAWRVLDAQYWGVPQRRKRIFLVADLAGGSAGKVLFESEGLSGYSAESFRAWQGAAQNAERCAGTSSVCLNDQGGERIEVSDDVTATIRAETHGHSPAVIQSAGFCMEHSAKARSISYEKETSPTLRAETVPAAVYENHSQDTRYTELSDVAPTVSSTYGTGGNNQPFVVESAECFDVRFTSEGTKNVRYNCYKTDTSRTIDTGGNSPDSNQGGVAVVESYGIQGSMIGRQDENGPMGSGISKDVSFTLNTTDRHAVAFTQDTYSKYAENTKGGALRANGGMYGGGSETLVTVSAEPFYIVRRLTPTECARLQGFPDWWCADIGNDNPNREEIEQWRQYFEVYRAAKGKKSKPKTDKQIIKWLKNPRSDSAEYAMWGNGVALPCVYFVLAGIAWCNMYNNFQESLCNRNVDNSTQKS